MISCRRWTEWECESALEWWRAGIATHYIAFILTRTRNSVAIKVQRLIGQDPNRFRCSRHQDLTGQVFGKLTVLKRDGYRLGRRAWLCQCDCGETIRVSTSGIVRYRTKSCGCLFKFEDGEASFNSLFATYRAGARNRGYLWDLTKEVFRELTKGNCFYCGSPPSRTITKYRPSGGYTYNGVDRVDNRVGYANTNCVSCCAVCNLMKLDSSKDDFLFQVNKIVAYQANLGQQQRREGSGSDRKGPLDVGS